ncbi:MAG: sigma-70 family RNA polymerase sigma factor [Candidatus Eremiobacteraeota bacterium]|nr:sigma-70 family RNA polymerase sigma factor [Candidatus Eremiobacteraeota bacterium]MCW5870813.1 sigma-70 family RNA polymerase sigma factor [Candidatus Eremiobacteraeota bacterium]
MSSIPPTASKIADELLVHRAQGGCKHSMNLVVCNYERLVHKMSQRFFLPGADRQDVVQEAMVGLAHAIKNFNPGYERKFLDYAVMCIRNSLLRAIRGANRKKQQILNQAGEMTDSTPVPTVSGVDEVVLDHMGLQEIWKILVRKLSPLETDVLRKRLNGEMAEEIAQELNLSLKQIENALFRARQKSRELMDQGRFASAA